MFRLINCRVNAIVGSVDRSATSPAICGLLLAYESNVAVGDTFTVKLFVGQSRHSYRNVGRRPREIEFSRQMVYQCLQSLDVTRCQPKRDLAELQKPPGVRTRSKPVRAAVGRIDGCADRVGETPSATLSALAEFAPTHRCRAMSKSACSTRPKSVHRPCTLSLLADSHRAICSNLTNALALTTCSFDARRLMRSPRFRQAGHSIRCTSTTVPMALQAQSSSPTPAANTARPWTSSDSGSHQAALIEAKPAKPLCSTSASIWRNSSNAPTGRQESGSLEQSDVGRCPSASTCSVKTPCRGKIFSACCSKARVIAGDAKMS